MPSSSNQKPDFSYSDLLQELTQRLSMTDAQDALTMKEIGELRGIDTRIATDQRRLQRVVVQLMAEGKLEAAGWKEQEYPFFNRLVPAYRWVGKKAEGGG